MLGTAVYVCEIVHVVKCSISGACVSGGVHAVESCGSGGVCVVEVRGEGLCMSM